MSVARIGFPFFALALVLLGAGAMFRTASLPFQHRNSPTPQKYLVETMGGGVALLDYDNDGLLDVFLVNSGLVNSGSLARPGSFQRRDPAFWNRLYRQRRDGTFEDVTEQAGLARPPDAYGMGVITGDIDNDGFPDLYVTGFGRNTLYRNNGNGTFTDITEKSGTTASGWSVSAAFLDYDLDGRLDLFVARYLDYDLSRNILCGKPFHTYCRPERYEGTTSLLFHNEGGGRFADVSDASGIASARGKGMGVAVHDYDGDGLPDIFVANDLMEQFLFHNLGKGKFQEVGMTAGVALSDDGKPYSGMGVAFSDYDNDGRPDILVTNLAQEKWALYRNQGNGIFSYASLSTGLAAATAPHSGWGAAFADFDNDGWKDIIAAQSHVLDNVEQVDPTLRYLEPPGVYRNVQGRFQPVATSLTKIAGRGAAFGDLNNDGAIDAVIPSLGGAPTILYGSPNANHWLILDLVGRNSNRDAAGAVVRIGSQSAYVTTSGSYLSASDRRLHFGLGRERSADIEIVWPGGRRQSLKGVAADQILTIREEESR